MVFESWIHSQASNLPLKGVAAVLELAGQGATVPFMARYRKEKTGNLDEVEIQQVLDLKERWDYLTKRREFVLGEIEKQGKLTPELKDKILACTASEVLEDLYLPYKVKRKSKAVQAKDAGLGPLAEWMWNTGHGTEAPEAGQTLDVWAFTYRNEKQGYNDLEAVIGGAMDILIERLSETQSLRQTVRSALLERGWIRTRKGESAKSASKYENYFQYQEPVASLSRPENSHRYLAMKRGWMEGELILTLGGKPVPDGEPDPFDNQLIQAFEAAACTVPDSPAAEVLRKAARLAYKAHVFPSLENEIHKTLKDSADLAGIHVFSENVRKILLSSPFGPKAVLGVDPGIRTGCKLAVIDSGGKYLGSHVLHFESDSQKKNALDLFRTLFTTLPIQAVAVGNGTYGRETEMFFRSTLKDIGKANIPVVMVSETGASVYSASEVAREEFPDLDLTIRGAISIARRLQDPLAELVKVDPKSLGVGQYQHDVSPSQLKRSLELVVDSCVNQVGVNVNTASPHLLAHVSGIGPALAQSIVATRTQKGLFQSRSDLLGVPRFSAKTFELSAGFLRIPESQNPLDRTGVHPERYEALGKIATQMKCELSELIGSGVKKLRTNRNILKELEVEVGTFTLQDILNELERPGRDPRESFVPFQFREDIHEIKDLQPGMICPGIVTNVTNFGAFVDIGVHQDGLVHLSQFPRGYVKDPKTEISPGDRVQVKVLEANLEKKQISLSLRQQEVAAAHPTPSASGRGLAPKPMRPQPSSPDQAVKIRPQLPGKAAPSSRVSTGPRDTQRPKPTQAFNNPFAALAAHKKQG